MSKPKRKIRVIFLDFDGVMRTYRSIIGGSSLPNKADAVCVENLNRIIMATGARIVVSSAWRGKYIAPVRRYLKSWGVRGQVVGVTPRLERVAGKRGPDRYDEIKLWMDSHGPVEAFVILDDDPIGYRGVEFIRTDFRTGITDRHVQKAITLLGRK